MFYLFSPRLAEYFDRTYRPVRLLSASPKTLAVYAVTLRFFDGFLGRPARLADLTDTTVSAFAQHRLTEVSPGTVKRDMDCLLAVWRLAHATGQVRLGPTIRPIHAATPAPVALTRDQLERVWRSIQQEVRPVAIHLMPLIEVPGPVWWSAIFLVCWDTAERIGAVFDLLEKDLDLAGGWVRFPASTRKGRSEDSIRQLGPDTVDALAALLGAYDRRQHNSRVFRWASNHGTVWPRLGAIMRRAGLPDSREFKFHCLRKSSVSHLAAAGGDPVAHAGHSSEAITRRHYLDQRIVHPRQAVDLLFRLGS